MVENALEIYHRDTENTEIAQGNPNWDTRTKSKNEGNCLIVTSAFLWRGNEAFELDVKRSVVSLDSSSDGYVARVGSDPDRKFTLLCVN